jgi:hypothetical protein
MHHDPNIIFAGRLIAAAALLAMAVAANLWNDRGPRR